MLVEMTPTLDQIARDRIKGWIATTHITQAALGARIGKDQSWVSTYLKGEHNADMETLKKIAAVFGHTFQSLLDQPSDPELSAFIENHQALPYALREHQKREAALLRAALTPPPRRRRRGSL